MSRGVFLTRQMLIHSLALVGLLAIVLTVHTQVPLQLGYAVIFSDAATSPLAFALFSASDSQGVLLWEAAVGAVEPIQRGRIFVDQGEATRTAVAIVNPSDHTLSVSFALRDSLGVEIDSDMREFLPGEHQALFIDELFENLGRLSGSLSIMAAGTGRFAAVTLRENRNLRDEAIFATLPVVDLDSFTPAEDTEQRGPASIIFPQVGAGDGLSTQIVLINGSDEMVAGLIRLFDTHGSSLILRLDGQEGSEFPFVLDPQATSRAELTSLSSVRAGFAVVTADTGFLPAGSAIFQFKADQRVISEAGVPATLPTDRVRIFVDMRETRTGLAVATVEDPDALVTFQLKSLDGLPLDSTRERISETGHAHFIDELFPELEPDFIGVLEVSGESLLAVVALKLTVNQRGDPILTTLPVADLNHPPQSDILILPQIAFGLGFSTDVIILQSRAAGSSAGRLSFFQSDGSPLQVPIGGELRSEVDFEISTAGATQFFPGRLEVSDILLPIEVVLEEEEAVKVSPILVGPGGETHENLPVQFTSTNTDVATVEADGTVHGREQGFSTLAVLAGEVVKTTTVTVVGLNPGQEGFSVGDLDADLAGQIFLASTLNHGILRAPELDQEPTPYAGILGSRGFRDDQRLNALFDQPAFIALDRNTNILYVSDSSNNRIRLVEPGPGGRVETLSGTGASGSRDGAADRATFNNPQGLALDNEGFLWVADSRNHTIRRIDLVGTEVETLAGRAGAPGRVDGTGPEARFSRPTGIAVEAESIVRKVEREAKGEPPPPVSLVVADTGNGLIRRISKRSADPNDPWVVETISASAEAASSRRSPYRNPITSVRDPVASNVSFDSPSGISVDTFGNIFVSGEGGNQVEVILPTGNVVPALPENRFDRPRGIAVTSTGRILVAEEGGGARKIDYGKPQILEAILGLSAEGEEQVTIIGRNFAPESLVLVGTEVVAEAEVLDTGTISFLNPAISLDRVIVSVQNRGGLAQFSASSIVLNCGGPCGRHHRGSFRGRPVRLRRPVGRGGLDHPGPDRGLQLCPRGQRDPVLPPGGRAEDLSGQQPGGVHAGRERHPRAESLRRGPPGGGLLLAGPGVQLVS